MNINKHVARNFLDEFKVSRPFKEAVIQLSTNSELRKFVFQEIQEKDYPYPEYASWLAAHYFQKFPKDMSQETFACLRKTLLETNNHTVQRNVSNALVFTPFPIHEDGELLDKAFHFLSDSETLPALKNYALQIIEKHYLKTYPELIMEIKNCFELLKNHPKPAVKAMIRIFSKKHFK